MMLKADYWYCHWYRYRSCNRSGDITILGGDLLLIPKAIKASKSTIRNIRQNLFWAFGYNVAGIPIATIGLLAPWLRERQWL